MFSQARAVIARSRKHELALSSKLIHSSSRRQAKNWGQEMNGPNFQKMSTIPLEEKQQLLNWRTPENLGIFTWEQTESDFFRPFSVTGRAPTALAHDPQNLPFVPFLFFSIYSVLTRVWFRNKSLQMHDDRATQPANPHTPPETGLHKPSVSNQTWMRGFSRVQGCANWMERREFWTVWSRIGFERHNGIRTKDFWICRQISPSRMPGAAGVFFFMPYFLDLNFFVWQLTINLSDHRSMAEMRRENYFNWFANEICAMEENPVKYSDRGDATNNFIHMHAQCSNTMTLGFFVREG